MIYKSLISFNKNVKLLLRNKTKIQFTDIVYNQNKSYIQGTNSLDNS